MCMHVNRNCQGRRHGNVPWLAKQNHLVRLCHAVFLLSHLPCDVVASRRHFLCVFVRIRFFTAPGCLACLDNCAEQNQYEVATLEAQSWCPMASKSAHQPLRLRASQRPQPENSYHHLNHVMTIILLVWLEPFPCSNFRCGSAWQWSPCCGCPD